MLADYVAVMGEYDGFFNTQYVIQNSFIRNKVIVRGT
jgi:hypothetical protein